MMSITGTNHFHDEVNCDRDDSCAWARASDTVGVCAQVEYFQVACFHSAG
jgi:hypothetical protein